MRRIPVLATTALALTLAACGQATPSTTSTASDGGSAAPSSAATPATPSTSAVTHADPAPHNQADTMFTQMMIVHHQGAVDMSKLAAERAQSPEVKSLAAKIEEAQGPEIQQMTEWLQAWGEPTDTGAHGHGHMNDPSMLMNGKTHEQVMTELRGLKGAEFDRAFLEAMIPHHEGAVTMSQDVLKNGQNPDVKALAQTIIDSQKREIDQMKTMLQRN